MSRYSPEVTPVSPSANPAESTDIQGEEQHGTPTFKGANESEIGRAHV